MGNLFLSSVSLALWVAAAAAPDVSGRWNVLAQGPGGREARLELVLKVDGDRITGTIGNDRGSVEISEAKLEGAELSFKIAVETTYSVKLAVAGGSMKGTSTGSDGSTWQVAASRPPAEKVSVAGRWKMIARSPGGREYNVDLELKDEGGKLGGTFTAEGMTLNLQEAKIEGKELSFKLATDRGDYLLKLTVDGDNMKGNYTGPDGQTGPVSASR